MFHKKRVWCVSPVGSAEELAEKITQHSWTLCTGFQIDGYLFLNYATSEDGAQEYAVVKCPANPGEPYRRVDHDVVVCPREGPGVHPTDIGR